MTNTNYNFSDIVFLTGFMASGKTTIGRHLSNALSADFIDLDTEIQINEGSSITDIFKKKGEKYFRDLESFYLKKLPFKQNHIIALGGGCFTRKENIDFIHTIGMSIFIDVPYEQICSRLKKNYSSRPLASIEDKNKLKSLYDDRQKFYTLSHKHFIFNPKYDNEEQLLHILKLIN